MDTFKSAADTAKEAVSTIMGRKPAGPKIRYGIVGAGWISQSSFMPGVGQTSNSSKKLSIQLFRVLRSSELIDFRF